MRKIENNNLFILFTSLFIIASLNPYFLWGWLQVALVVTLMASLFFGIKSNNIVDAKKIYTSFAVAFLTFAYSLSNGASIFGALAIFASTLIFSIIKSEQIIKIFQKFKFLLSLFLLPGTVLWLIHNLIDSSLFYIGSMPVDLIPNGTKVEAGQGYAVYPFAIVLDYMLDYPLYRMAGVFDEPGVVGTICALTLAANKFKIEKKFDIVIFVAGILSFSLAFYIMFFFYKAIAATKKIRSIAIFAMTTLLLIAAASQMKAVDDYIFSRLTIEDGSITGDNRSDDSLEDYFDKWKSGSASEVLFGEKEYKNTGASSWKEIPIKTGLVGVLIFLLIFFILLLMNNTKTNIYLLSFVMVFISSIYQRPYVVAPFFILIFISGVVKNSKIEGRKL